LALLFNGCAEGPDDIAALRSAAVNRLPMDAPGGYKIGQPYEVDGVWYFPQEVDRHDETGIASWYGAEFHGQATANGERFDQEALSAAHRTLPMPSLARVTNLENGKSVVVRINDRGPFARGRIIDVSRRSARLLGFERQGTARVRVSLLGAESRRLKRQALARGGETQVAAAAPQVVVPGAAAVPAPSRATSGLEQHRRQAVGHQPVRATALYVQVGAFADRENADRLRRTLRAIGQVTVSSLVLNGRRLYRVRLGPVTTVAAADRLLDHAFRAGYTQARIAVE
jgi:rare lipoprotein A